MTYNSLLQVIFTTSYDLLCHLATVTNNDGMKSDQVTKTVHSMQLQKFDINAMPSAESVL